MNNDIIGTFIGCVAKTRINKWAMIRLCLNIFDSIWCYGLVEVVMSLDENLRVPLLKMYMEHPPGNLVIANILRRPTLVIRDQVNFNEVWLKMNHASNFFLDGIKLRKIMELVSSAIILVCSMHISI